MEVKVPEIQPMTLDGWTRTFGDLKRDELVKPVEGLEGGKTGDTTEEKVDLQTKLLKVSIEEAKKLAEKIEQYLSEMNVSLSFDIDDKTQDVIVKVINKETGKVIRQVPPQELLKLRQKLEELVGVLFNRKV